MPETKKKPFPFTLGADPEFILTMQGRKVDAKQTMQLMLRNKEDLEEISTRNGQGGGWAVGKAGNIGYDGADSTGEVRPAPSHDPKEIVSNLATLFKTFTKYIKICDMSTISEFSSIGGHIHLEVPKGEVWTKEKRNTIERRLASFYLPLLLTENKTNLNLRLKQTYGSITDIRLDNQFDYPDGTSGYTVEYRSPSAEWLTTPKIASATLCYFAVVYHEILNNPKSFVKFNDLIFKSDKQADALQALAIMEFDLLTNTILNKARKYIRTFEKYKEYKDEIEYIFNYKQVIKDKIKANYDITVGWNLVEKTVPKKSEILASKKRIQAIAKEKDFDMFKKVMNIHYNDDANVALFAENLKDRVAAFNWKLKNNYFLFGMRKGINEIVAKNMKQEYLTGNNLLKTILDKEQMDRLFNKMNDRFNDRNSFNQGATIDFTTGKAKDQRESSIVIGIPYDSRIKEDIKPFLNFVWALEKGEITKQKMSELINDAGDQSKYGEIFKILTKQNESPQQVVVDSGSNSLRSHNRAVETLISEGTNSR